MPIPFIAHVEQTINDAVRFPQQVFTPEFQVKMLRHVATSPDGAYVAYSAIGHLYLKQLPDGEPRRLTTTDAFEFYPSGPPTGSRSSTRPGQTPTMDGCGSSGATVPASRDVSRQRATTPTRVLPRRKDDRLSPR